MTDQPSKESLERADKWLAGQRLTGKYYRYALAHEFDAIAKERDEVASALSISAAREIEVRELRQQNDALVSALRQQNDALVSALRQWKCPSCGGTGHYSGYSKEAPNGSDCRKCKDMDGLHPIAFAALAPYAATKEAQGQGE